MARRTIDEIFGALEIDTSEEYQKLYEMVFEDDCSGGWNLSLAQYCDEHFTRQFSLRGTEVCLLGVWGKLDCGAGDNHEYDSADRLLLFCELLVRFFSEAWPMIEQNNYNNTKPYCTTILGNIRYLLEKLGYEIRDIEAHPIICEKNQVATIAAQVVENQELIPDIYEYNHFSMKGDLDKKKRILLVLANEFEPHRTELEQHGFQALASDLGYLLNSMHIRHNNKEGNKLNAQVVGMSSTELEAWYDKTYQALLLALIAIEYIPTSQEVIQLKKKSGRVEETDG